MDTKRLIIGMSLAMLVMVGWTFLLQFLDTKYPQWDMTGARARQAATQPAVATQPTAGQAVAPPSQAATVAPTEATPLVAAPTTGATAAIGAANGLRVLPPSAEPSAGEVTLGSGTKDDATYAMGVRLARDGGGIDSVTLNQFWQT
ncbi:MAG TPA: hypothetical protein VK324_01755, partial [Tepidisphaeraceae bacterium]|nr:hypothetical protein [Tepidisphaeraceae bacterium]